MIKRTDFGVSAWKPMKDNSLVNTIVFNQNILFLTILDNRELIYLH